MNLPHKMPAFSLPHALQNVRRCPAVARRLTGRLWRVLQPWLYGAEEARLPVLTTRLRLGILGRFVCLAVTISLLFLLMLKHVYNVQVLQHERYSTQALAICRRQVGEAAQRGRIMDQNGNLLAGNVATRDIYVEPKRFAGRLPEVTRVLADRLGLDYATLHGKFKRAIAHVFPYKVCGDMTLKEISALKLMSVPGVRIRPSRPLNTFKPNEEPLFNVYLCFEAQTSAAQEEGRKGTLRTVSPEISRSCHILAKALDRDADELIGGVSRAMDRCQEVIVKWNASREEADALMAALQEIQITSGVRVTDSWTRSYPRNCLFANMLGYLSAEGKGVSGIEKLMDSYLQPTSGRFSYLRDRYGVMVEDEVTYEVEPKDGADVYLTIQEPLQQIVEEELAALWEKYKPEHAYAILLEPSTGAVMALAQFPQFDPNDRGTLRDGGSNAQNYCLIHSYEPGSIMKPISLSGVLENRAARLDTVVDCEHGYWKYGGAPLRDSHQYDDLTLSEVVKKSSNIGTAKLALELGDEKMYDNLAAFGFGRRTGLGFYPEEGKPVFFANEANGIFRPLRQWRKISITRMSIGQSINVTPLQIVQAWSALANDGTMMQPYIIDRIQFPDGRIVYSRPFAKGQPITPDTAHKIRQALKTVTEEGGTGVHAALKGYAVAGKTGTAQICQPADPARGIKAGYNNSDYFASFIGFVPADNPRFLLLVSAEHPTAVAHTGAGVSAPTFKRIAERTLEYLRVPPEAVPETPAAGKQQTAMRR